MTLNNAKTYIETERLILRQWKESDRDVFAELNQNPENLLFFPNTLTRKQSDDFINKTIQLIDNNGYGLFAVELKETSEFIGFTGLATPSFEAHFTPCTEVGWRLHKNYWGKGYATEAAKSVLNFAFNKLYLGEVVSFTSLLNTPSINVMKRIGMTHDPSRDFEHPRIEKGHKLRPHTFYQIKKENFKED
jgi:ribosomal-protein-alanine N-acetyltransferase